LLWKTARVLLNGYRELCSESHGDLLQSDSLANLYLVHLFQKNQCASNHRNPRSLQCLFLPAKTNHESYILKVMQPPQPVALHLPPSLLLTPFLPTPTPTPKYSLRHHHRVLYGQLAVFSYSSVGSLKSELLWFS